MTKQPIFSPLTSGKIFFIIKQETDLRLLFLIYRLRKEWFVLKKKLTHSSFMPAALCALALVLSASAAASEFIGRYTYRKLFGETAEYIVTNNSFEFFESYSKVILLTVVSALFFIMQVSSLRTKKIGGSELSLTFGVSVLIGIFSGVIVFNHASSGAYLEAFNLSNQGLFVFLFREGIEWLAVASALLIALSSLWLMIRLHGESLEEPAPSNVPQDSLAEQNSPDSGLVFGAE